MKKQLILILFALALVSCTGSKSSDSLTTSEKQISDEDRARIEAQYGDRLPPVPTAEEISGSVMNAQEAPAPQIVKIADLRFDAFCRETDLLPADFSEAVAKKRQNGDWIFEYRNLLKPDRVIRVSVTKTLTTSIETM